MDIIEKLLGEIYPKLESAIYADGSKTVVTVSRKLSPDHVDLDSPSYIENKLKKRIPILKEIGITKNQETDEQSINVTVEVGGTFNNITNLDHLTKIAKAISKIAECRLSEPEVVKSISMGCKTFVHNESEETQTGA